jgi:hypothetical protein
MEKKITASNTDDKKEPRSASWLATAIGTLLALCLSLLAVTGTVALVNLMLGGMR